MKRSTKLLLGAATVWPVVYIFLFFAFIMGMIALSGTAPNPNLDPVFGGAFIVIFILHMFTIFLSLGLTIFYLVHAIKNDSLKSEMKAVWGVLFFLGGIFAEPVYWHLNIWQETPTPEHLPGYLQPPTASSWGSGGDARAGTYVPPSEMPDWR